MQRVISFFQEESYGERFPAMRPLREEDVFVEVDCYSLTIPEGTEGARYWEAPGDVDIFADTVLRLVGLGRGYTERQIADMMCVDPDFIRFILVRLREAGLLDEKGRMTDRGRGYSGSLAGHVPQAGRKLEAHAFAVKGTDRFLSYIHTQPLSFENVDTSRRDSLTIRIGTAGRAQAITGRLVRARAGREQRSRPRQEDWQRLIRSYNLLCRGMGRSRPIGYQTGYMIDGTWGQEVVLHCKLVVQGGSVDNILLSDGFSLNCDELCRQVLASDPGLERRLLAEAVRITARGAGKAEATEADVGREPPPERYGEIIRRLGEGEAVEADSMDAVREAAANDDRRARRLFEAVEWALLYSVEQSPPPEPLMGLFRGQTGADNCQTLLGLAGKIRLDTAGHERLFAQLTRAGMDRCFRNREPMLGVLWPLAVAAAAEDPFLPLHGAIAGNPELLGTLETLQGISARARHEAGAGWLDPELLAALDGQALDFIRALLPDLELDGERETRPGEGASQRRVNARFSLSQKLGWDLFQSLEGPVREELLLISPDKGQDELPPPNEFVFTLSRILEYSFREVLRQSRFRSEKGKAQVIAEIERVAGRRLPDIIRTVSPQMLEAELRGRSATLNGCFVAMLYYWTERKPEELAGFWEDGTVELVGAIGRLRGHTAELAFRVSAEELAEHRERTFGVIKRLAAR